MAEVPAACKLAYEKKELGPSFLKYQYSCKKKSKAPNFSISGAGY